MRSFTPFLFRFRVSYLILLILLCGAGYVRSGGYLSLNLSTFWRMVEQHGGSAGSNAQQAMQDILEQQRSLDETQKLEMVNRYFETWVTYQTDDVVWGQTDYWASPAELLGRGQGDCEDYAIAKYLLLLEMGIPPARLRLIYVKAKIGGRRSTVTQAHMVLGYYATADAEPLILDSLIGDVLPARQRTDLSPVFSFNSNGIWSGGAKKSVGSPTARLSRWRNVLQKLSAEGIELRS